MAYDEALAQRIRDVLKRRRGFTEQKMFGGIAFLLHGNMCCGVIENYLVLRLGEDGTLDALRRDHTAPMDFTGRVMKSMVYIEPAGLRDVRSLRRWIDKAIGFTRTLPKKSRAV